ncbi:NlpC/P60 family protein [Brevundimonas sp. Root1423]|uniref:C40 family peptidase n=1 Tax=Brevundimonas sp. Root1423 TaxID=1736462 RepID=UPI0006F9E0F1|nr:NlpC/P60 family protein [Brevundimonas sp. Root1423]KQY85866.1 glycoside hydrolase [Brevundimonas sp. Root1423]
MTEAAAILDPRTTLARPDLAEQALEGVVRAAAFRAVWPMHCAVPVADIHADAAPGDHPIDQLIFGEAFDVLDSLDDRLWGRARRDGVVGWVDAACLTGGAPLATHRIEAVDGDLPLNALVSGPEKGAGAIGSFADDVVEVAQRFLGVPHRPGERTSRGTDCCGLVQQALYACGRAAPRYADQQAELGAGVPVSEARHGDLVVWLSPGEGPWNGHAGFILGPDRVLHATGHHGAVVIEAFAEADARHRGPNGAEPLIRRL